MQLLELHLSKIFQGHSLSLLFLKYIFFIDFLLFSLIQSMLVLFSRIKTNSLWLNKLRFIDKNAFKNLKFLDTGESSFFYNLTIIKDLLSQFVTLQRQLQNYVCDTLLQVLEFISFHFLSFLKKKKKILASSYSHMKTQPD